MLHLPFDEIYCLNLVERTDRYEQQKIQYEYLGISNNIIFYRDVTHPFVNDISSFLRKNKIGCLFGAAFNCTRNHYTIIKSAYLRGVTSIMIIEDDNQFYKDPDILQKYFDNLPEDWEILRVNCLRGKGEDAQFNRSGNTDKLWGIVETAIWGTGCYALSREGMRKMIEWIDSRYDAIDVPLFYYWESKIKMYIPKLPLGLCIPELSGTDIYKDDYNLLHGPQFYYKDIENIDLTMYQY